MEAMNPKKPTKRKVTDKAGAILGGAMQEFMTCGYAAASMDRIAIAAGVSKTTLYSYFQDKEGLFFALIQKMSQGNREVKLLEGDMLLQLPLRYGLKQVATLLLDEFYSEQSLSTFIRLIIGESERFPDLAQMFIRNAEKPMLEKLTYLFSNHADIKATDPEVTARCFHGSIVHYIILQEILHGQKILPLERDRFINGLIDLILCGQLHSSDEFANPKTEG
jgi:TetR/AcrR family transcriptional regulator, regulator of autoinduction and epiphytic fitness